MFKKMNESNNQDCDRRYGVYTGPANSGTPWLDALRIILYSLFHMLALTIPAALVYFGYVLVDKGKGLNIAKMGWGKAAFSGAGALIFIIAAGFIAVKIVKNFVITIKK